MEARCGAQAFSPRGDGWISSELEISLIYIVSSRPAKAAGEILFQNQNKTKRRTKHNKSTGRSDLDQGPVLAQRESPEILVQGCLALGSFLSHTQH